ncbi:MAG: hypothetical protein NVSMB32_05750 [Actinomycetota bacterium]
MERKVGSRRSRFVGAIALVGAMAVGTACGGGSSPNANPPVARSQSPSLARASSSPQPQAARTVGKTVWFEGFKLTIDTASFLPPSPGTFSGQVAQLTLNATFENLGNDPAMFNGASSVNSHGQDFPASSSGTIPNIPGGGKGKGTIIYDVDSAFALDSAVITFGKPDETKAKVPLGASGSLVALAPLPVSGLASVTAGENTVAMKSGEARADKVSEHGQAATGHWYVYIKGALSRTAGGNGNFGAADLALKLPDGTSVVGEAADTKSCCYNLTPGQPEDFTFRFLVGDPPSGSYSGTIKGSANGTDVTAPFAFQVAAAPAGGSGSAASPTP